MSSVPKKQLMSSSLDTFNRSFIIYKFIIVPTIGLSHEITILNRNNMKMMYSMHSMIVANNHWCTRSAVWCFVRMIGDMRMNIQREKRERKGKQRTAFSSLLCGQKTNERGHRLLSTANLLNTYATPNQHCLLP